MKQGILNRIKKNLKKKHKKQDIISAKMLQICINPRRTDKKLV